MPSHHLQLLHRLRNWLGTLADRLLPGCCALCGLDSSALICARCDRRYLAHGGARCACCALPLAHLSGALPPGTAAGPDTETETHAETDTDDPSRRPPDMPQAVLCGRCLAAPPAFDASFAATLYLPPVDLLVQALKFRARLPLAKACAQQMLQTMAHEPRTQGELVLAVPLSAERLAQRGFNQAQEIARPIARALELPLPMGVCVRVRDTVPQSGLAPADRRDNMRGAFAVMRREAIDGKRVLVVDDVMTTGHTLNALARCLKRHGAAHVTNLVFARTPPH